MSLLTAAAAREAPLEERYKQAIELAKKGQLPSLPLTALPPGESTVRVVTWTPDRTDVGAALDANGNRQATGDVWVTLQSEIQPRCKGFSQEERKDLPLRVKQLLGLPPYFKDAKAGGFAVMDIKVPATPGLFRPCMNPDPTQSACTAPPRLPADPKGGHEEWMVRAAASNYDAKSPADRFPWTQLGYTYDWATPARPYGLSEYIVKDGAFFKQIVWQPIEEFCAVNP